MPSPPKRKKKILRDTPTLKRFLYTGGLAYGTPRKAYNGRPVMAVCSTPPASSPDSTRTLSGGGGGDDDDGNAAVE